MPRGALYYSYTGILKAKERVRSDLMSLIEESYLLCVCVPVSIDRDGRRWTDELWAKDLELHLEYLADLTLACPIVKQQPKERETCLNRPPFDRVKFIDLPYPRSYGAALRSLPE